MAESDRFNTTAGWVLFSGIIALGLSAVSSGYFQADKHHAPKEEAAEGGGGKAAVPIETLLASADPAKGEAASKKCAACHTFNQGGANGIGPNLYGVLGEAVAAGRGGFAFSDALKAKGGKWDFTSLNEWLTSPKAFAPGTKMSFAGIPDAAERANLMAWLNTLGSNLPLPAAPAAPAAGEEGAAPAAAAVVGDAAAGEKSFAKCKACHTITPGGANGIGPNLAGVHGEPIGQGRGGFAFSDALKGKGGNWDDASLDAWLTNPKSFAPGTKMTFAGIADAQERANVIAYLKTVK
ncbi:c-type cytochrome [Novosphingobium aquiterrae]|uniref:C-type cytochrome n=1 Tax=Novosphingobium aquiterrae TaxID=624388 RepID=A0ABV6PJZ9_9SPHN